MQSQTIKEGWDGAFAEAGVAGTLVKNVKLLGRVSKNGRVYSERAISDAVRLYDGVPVYFDHPTVSEERERNGNRSVRDLAGRVRSPRVAGDEIRGDLQLVDFGESIVGPATLIRALAQQMPTVVGMSHSASGVLAPGKDSEPDIVESLDAVHSVDLVTNPATTAGLFESLSNKEFDMDWKDISLADLKTRRPDLLKSIRAELDEGAEAKAIREERDRLRQENETLKQADALRSHKAIVDKKLADAKLPESVVSDSFREMLCSAKDAAAVDALLAPVIELAKNVKAGGPRSTERTHEETFERRDEELTESEMAGLAPGGAHSLFI